MELNIIFIFILNITMDKFNNLIIEDIPKKLIKKCEHNKYKTRCIKCGGGSICEHDKRKDCCKLCGGDFICIHNKYKSICKECKGRQIDLNLL